MLGNLTAQGTATTENVESILTKGAVTVINSENHALEATLIRAVIRTGKTDEGGNYIDYAILYSPLTEEVQLGVGIYNADTNQFSFNEREGKPIAVRNLTTEDDGSFVV